MSNLISGAQRHGKVKTALFDRGYIRRDSAEFEERGIKPVIKPKKTMGLKKSEGGDKERELLDFVSSKNRERKREDRSQKLCLTTLKEYLKDKERWKKENGIAIRWKVEERYSVFKRLFSEYVF
jgi:hypothetical protein